MKSISGGGSPLRGRLLGLRAASDAEVPIRPGQAELLEEDASHLLVVVLAGVQEPLRDALMGAKRLHDGGDLHEVRPGADDVEDVEDLHEPAPCPTSCRDVKPGACTIPAG